MRHYEDFPAGCVIDLGAYHVGHEDVVAFARQFDPQPFHLDAAAATASVLGGLSASGWHTCAILMRMMCDAFLADSAGMGSSGIEEAKWLRPVFAGETLAGTMTVVEARVSAKRPGLGILKCRWELQNATGERKAEIVGMLFMAVKNP